MRWLIGRHQRVQRRGGLRIVQACGQLGRQRDGRQPDAVSRLLGQLFGQRAQTPTRRIAVPQLGVGERQPRAGKRRPGKPVDDCLQLAPHLRQFALLPPRQRRLDQAGEHGVGSPRLSGQGLVGQPLRVGEGAREQRSQCSHRGRLPPVDGDRQLLGQPCVNGNLGPHGPDVTGLERGGRPGGVTVQLHLPVAGLPPPSQHLFGQRGALLQPVRAPHRHPAGIEHRA